MNIDKKKRSLLHTQILALNGLVLTQKITFFFLYNFDHDILETQGLSYLILETTSNDNILKKSF